MSKTASSYSANLSKEGFRRLDALFSLAGKGDIAREDPNKAIELILAATDQMMNVKSQAVVELAQFIELECLEAIVE